jgi:hypothetical protein
MNHNAPAGNGETWPAASRDESSAAKKKRRSKRNNKRKSRPDTSAATAGKPERSEIKAGGPREYSAEKLSEAVIWVRDDDQLEDGSKPLIPSGKVSPSAEAVTEQVQIIEHDEAEVDALADDFAAAPNTNQRDALESAPAREREWAAFDHQQHADHETPQPPERRFFWNQADVYSPNDRDRLPTVSGGSSPNKAEPAAEPAARAEIPDVPALEKAVNPNAAAAASNAPSPQEATVISGDGAVKSKSGFMSRRRTKRAVQSQEMEGESFEQTAAEPFPAAMPYDSSEYAGFAAGEAPGEPAEHLPAQINTAETAAEMPPPVASTSDVLAEKLPEPAFANQAEQPLRQPELAPTERNPGQQTVEHALQRSELLGLAKSIRVDGVSVYEMFTAKRIDEEGLRRIIVSYLRGDELRQMIAGEVIRQQMKFERDPSLRDTPVNTPHKDKPGATRRAAKKIKKGTKSLLDVDRAKDRTERLAEITQDVLEKSHGYLHENPSAGRNFGIIAIVVIYLMILIVALVR